MFINFYAFEGWPLKTGRLMYEQCDYLGTHSGDSHCHVYNIKSGLGKTKHTKLLRGFALTIEIHPKMSNNTLQKGHGL